MADEKIVKTDEKPEDKVEKSEKDAKAGKKKGRGLGKRIAKYFRDLKGEFKKIIWPEQKSVVRQTIAVVAVSVVTGLIIALLDWAIQHGVNFLVGLNF